MKGLFRFILIAILSQTVIHASEPQKEEKTVFITGAAGFIGSNFLEYMFDKYPQYNFIVLDALTYAGSLDNIPSYIKKSDRFQFVHGSVTDYPLVEKIMSSANFVVHMAAESHVTRSIAEDFVFFDTDVLGTRAMMAALVKHANKVERFVHFSTSEVYGTAAYQPMDEKHPIEPKSPYAAAKAGADRLVYAYGCTYDVPVVIIRPFNNYGPRQHLEKLIPRLIYLASHGQDLTVHGTGQQARDWVSTYDVSIALDKILHLPDFSKIKNQEINLGSGNPISILEIAKKILQHFDLGEEHLKFTDDRPGQVDLHISSTFKAKALLDWEASTSFDEGLNRTIDWYLSHPEFWERTKNNALVKIKTKNGETEL